MPSSTVMSKERITIPKEIRDLLRLKEGDRVELFIEASGNVEIRPVSSTILSLYGTMHRPGMRPTSIPEMDEAEASPSGAQSANLWLRDLRAAGVVGTLPLGRELDSDPVFMSLG